MESEKVVPMLPKEFMGENGKKTEYVKNTPRKWTKEEEQWCLDLRRKGFTSKEIAESVSRGEVSVSIKLKRLGKINNTYNAKHVNEKYIINDEFVKYIAPKTVLDVYCGVNKFYCKYDDIDVITNDIDSDITSDYSMDSMKFMCLMYSENNSFDIVDVDPYGSAFDCFDLAIKMAKKGLAVTLGEIGHKRFKRLDFVSRYYGINKLEDFTSDNIIKHIQEIGIRNKKDLVVWRKADWNGISRVWFEIKDYKVIDTPMFIENS